MGSLQIDTLYLYQEQLATNLINRVNSKTVTNKTLFNDHGKL